MDDWAGDHCALLAAMLALRASIRSVTLPLAGAGAAVPFLRRFRQATAACAGRRRWCC